MSKERDFGVLAFFLPYTLLGIALTFVALLLLSAVYLFIPFSPRILKFIAAAVSVCVILIISYSSSKESGSVLTGGITALIYSVIHSLLAVIFGVIPFISVRTPFVIATGFLIGFIGAVFGGGREIGRRRRYR